MGATCCRLPEPKVSYPRVHGQADVHGHTPPAPKMPSRVTGASEMSTAIINPPRRTNMDEERRKVILEATEKRLLKEQLRGGLDEDRSRKMREKQRLEEQQMRTGMFARN